MEQPLDDVLARMGMGLYALTFEEYGITSLAELPPEHGERDGLLAELGLTPNDRWRLHEVVRDQSSLGRLAQLRAEADPFSAAAVRRQREANEACKASFAASAAGSSAGAFAALSAAHVSDALCAEPPRVLEPSAFGTPAAALVREAHVRALARDGLVVLDGALDARTLERARAEARALPLQPTVQDARTVRGDEVCWVDVRDGSRGVGASNEALCTCARLLVGVLARLNEALPAAFPRSDAPQRVMLSRYAHGAAYAPHLDNPAADARARPDDERRRREWTVILYLNEPEWPPERGGLLRCHPRAPPGAASRGAERPAPPVDVAPAGGRLVVFSSEAVLHEVLPVAARGVERYALTLWSVRRAQHQPGPPPAHPALSAATAATRAADDERAEAAAAACAPACTAVLFASVGASLEHSAGRCSLAIENGDFLSLLCAASVPCAHAALDAAAVLAEMRGAVGPSGEMAAAEAYASAVGARLACAPPVDWGSVHNGGQLRALALRPGCALAAALCAREKAPTGGHATDAPAPAAPAMLLLVLDGYDVLHGLPVPALRALALAQLRACGVRLAEGAVRTAVRAMCETSRVGEAAAARLGCADSIWVPAANSEAALRASGVGGAGGGCAAVRTLPQLSVPSRRPQSAAQRAPGSARPFTLLSVVVGTDGWHFSRKGLDVLLRAFAAALGSEGAARLVLKLGSGADAQRVRAFCEREGGALGGLLSSGRLALLCCWHSAADLEALIASCDALVMPSRGEGWCRPLADAMALGTPVVGVPGSGGPADFLDESVGWCVRSRAAPVAWQVSAAGAWSAQLGGRELGEWAEPDEAHLALVLRALYEQRGGARVSARAAAAAERMRERYSSAPIQARLLELVAEIAGRAA